MTPAPSPPQTPVAAADAKRAGRLRRRGEDDLLPWGRGKRVGSAVNFVALLAVLAATSFVLPLLVQGCEALGLARGVSVAVSLALALGAVLAWGVRTWRATTVRRGATFRPRARERARAGRGSASGGVVDGAAVRLVEAEEESRAGV